MGSDSAGFNKTGELWIQQRPRQREAFGWTKKEPLSRTKDRALKMIKPAEKRFARQQRRFIEETAIQQNPSSWIGRKKFGSVRFDRTMNLIDEAVSNDNDRAKCLNPFFYKKRRIQCKEVRDYQDRTIQTLFLVFSLKVLGRLPNVLILGWRLLRGNIRKCLTRRLHLAGYVQGLDIFHYSRLSSLRRTPNECWKSYGDLVSNYLLSVWSQCSMYNETLLKVSNYELCQRSCYTGHLFDQSGQATLGPNRILIGGASDIGFNLNPG